MPCSTGVHGVFKGASQLAKAYSKYMRVPPNKPEYKIMVILFAAQLKYRTNVWLGIASVVVQLIGADKADTEDQEQTNDAYWTACHAYL